MTRATQNTPTPPGGQPSPLLEVRNLRVHFPVLRGLFRPVRQHLKAVDDVSFAMGAGETVGLVGESGCGKTSLARAIAGLTRVTAGSIRFENREVTGLSQRQLRFFRRNVQMIFQDPNSSLDPRLTVEDTIGEALDIHGLAGTSAARQARVADLLRAVGLDRGDASRYPHEFSGGQRQRIGIARALAVEPKLIICDEPVSALDVSVQAQIVNLLQDLQQQHGLAYLFIAHDLAVVEHISHRILVMYLGRIVESAAAAAVIRQPLHPYTRALISAVPVVDPASRRQRILLGGDVPSPIEPPAGCPFHPRCPIVEARCHTQIPPLKEITPGHWVACHPVADAAARA